MVEHYRGADFALDLPGRWAKVAAWADAVPDADAWSALRRGLGLGEQMRERRVQGRLRVRVRRADAFDLDEERAAADDGPREAPRAPTTAVGVAPVGATWSLPASAAAALGGVAKSE